MTPERKGGTKKTGSRTKMAHVGPTNSYKKEGEKKKATSVSKTRRRKGSVLLQKSRS